MQKLNYPCPCGGTIKWKKQRIIQQGIDCGILDVEQCIKCHEIYLPEESMRVVEGKLKKAGLWGIERKEIKFWKTGNSITIRLPTDFVKKLNLNAKKGFVYKEGQGKIIIEY